jgi:phosphatidylglycerophosphate synthase
MDNRRPEVTFASALKDVRVEELLNLHWHRPLAFALVRRLHPVKWVSPNHLTAVGLLLGIGAGLAAHFAAHPAAKGPASLWLLAAALLWASVIFDCADGMLARSRGGGTRFGMLLDGAADHAVGLAVWAGLVSAALRSVEGSLVWPAATFALVSTIVQCAVYDQVKLAFLGEVPAPVAPQSRIERLFDAVYRATFGAVGAVLASGGAPHAPFAHGGARGPAVDETRQIFMHRISFLGLGTHFAVTYVAMALGVLWPAVSFWVPLLVFGVGMNLWMVAALASGLRAARAPRRVGLTRRASGTSAW